MMAVSKEEIISYVKNKIGNKRFLHSINTAKEAASLAKRYGADENKAYIAGLLHDVAKGIPNEALETAAAENGIEIDEYEKKNPVLIHGKVGAAMVRKDLGIDDGEILSAIKWHTTGYKNMTLLEKIIYLADIIEPGRNFKETNKLRETAYKDIDKAMALGLSHVMSFVRSRGLTLHPNSIEAYESLITESPKS
jgi:predicted HD superfamily hydrolase involved in NAD metabolism